MKFNFETNAVVLKLVLTLFFMQYFTFLFQICFRAFLKSTMTALIFRLAHGISFFHWHHFINMFSC